MKFKTIHSRLTFFFLVFGVVPLVLAMFIEHQEAAYTIEQATIEHLKSVRAIRGRQLVEYMNFVRDEMIYLAKNHTTVEAAKVLTAHVLAIKESDVTPEMYADVSRYYQNVFLNRYNSLATYPINLGAVMPSDYRTVYLQYKYVSNRAQNQFTDPYDWSHNLYHDEIIEFLHRFSYSNIDIVDAKTGYVVYSGIKSEQFGTNLLIGPYSESVMGRLFKEMRFAGSDLTVQFADLEAFIPSLNKPVLLVGAPITEGDKLLAVLIMTVPSEDINMITAGANNWNQDGMGKTGESYIVGKDLRMRSDSRAIAEDFDAYLKDIKAANDTLTQIEQIEKQRSSILYQHVNNPEILRVFADSQEVVGIGINYRGREVIRSAAPLKIYDLNWAIVAEIETQEAYRPVEALRRRSIIAVVVLMAVIILAASFISSSITSPIRKMVEATRLMARGNLAVRLTPKRVDELGKLALSFNSMAESLQRQQSEIQAQNASITQKNIELSQALELLSQKNAEIEQQRDSINLQKNQLESAYTKIKASISYALRIQQAMLPPIASIKAVIPDFFVMFRPKDVVSGDFYWFGQVIAQDGRKRVVLAVVDCTGHGVPGAFMSLIGNDLLDTIVLHDRIVSPNQILRRVHEGIIDSLNQRNTDSKEGMDIGICVLDFYASQPTITFAGAQHSLVMVADDKIHVYQADRVSLGGTFCNDLPDFREYVIPIQKSDTFYLFSDGFQDQFGGPKNTKYYSRRLMNFLLELSKIPDMDAQRMALETEFETWKGNQPQVDDVLVMGVRI